MPKPTDYDKTHLRNMAAIGTRIDRIFKKAAEEAAKIGVSIKSPLPEDRIFSFDDYPETKKQIERLITALQESMETTIVNGVRSSWTLSNNKNNALVSRIFGDRVGDLSKEQYRRYFSTNGAALDAFLQRKEQGLNLSDRVWRYTTAFKREIELGLDLGIRTGESADQMSRSLRQYLQHPDKLFRRVRDKHGNLKLSKAARDYHPGRGVYRSSYKNARRLACTETNIAYRTSDYLRWQQMDFVVGIEIKLSNNHTLNGVPLTDICDTLAGRYPKDFKFTGWHPHCRCHVVTVLKTDDEMAEDTQRILAGEQPKKGSVNTVRDVPDAFKSWVEEHSDRIEMGGNLPYFVKDNRKRVDNILGIAAEPQKTPLEIAKERHDARTPAQAAAIQQKWNETRLQHLAEAIDNGYLPKEVKEQLGELLANNDPEYFEEINARIAYLQKTAQRHAARTPQEIEDIKKAWEAKLTRDRNTRIMADSVLKLRSEYPLDVDFSALEKIIADNNLTKMREEARNVAQAIKTIRVREKALSDLIPDAHGWHKTFSLSELQEAHGKIQSTLDYWKAKGYDLATDSHLDILKKELEQKIKFVENPGAFKAGLKAHKTWQVQQDSYIKLLDKVETRIETITLEADYNTLLGFKTTSKDFKNFMAKAKAALDAGDVKTAKSYIASAQWKKKTLEHSRKGKTTKLSGGMSYDTLYSGGCPFTPAEIAQIKDYEDQILQSMMDYGFVGDDLNKKYHDYILRISKKYYDKQKSLFSAAEQATMKKAADTYLARPSINPGYVWGTDVGGVYKGRYRKRYSYLKELGNGITADELSIVQRFTNGSTFSNAYNLRHSSPYWAKKWKEKMAKLIPAQAKEMEQIIEEWSQGANFTLDRMVRYNGITFRGLDCGGGPELRAQLTKAFNSGTVWVNEASCSTSMKYSVASSFDGDLIMIIHNKTGAYIHAMSDYSSEYEIMTLRGAKYRVIKPPTQIGGRWIAELEEI